MKTVLVSVDGSDASRAAVRWCADNVTPDDRILAVSGLGPVGEFVLEFPGFDSTSPRQLRETFRHRWCAPLDHAGLHWEPLFLNQRQGVALARIVQRESPDLVVLGKPEHLGVDLLLHGLVQHALHRAGCPVVLVPAPPSQRGRRALNDDVLEDAP